MAKYRANSTDTWKTLKIKALDSMVIGSVIQFVGTTIPTGWLECDGSSITQSAYPELYALIGGTLPNFKGKVLVGQDTSDTDFDTLLETGGSKELQKHNHLVGNSAGAGSTSAWGFPSEYNSNMGELLTSEAGTGNSGNLQPYAVVKHIIKAKNTTPTMASIVDAYSTSTQDGYSCNFVNDLVNYSTTETIIGKYGNETLYRKVINLGSIVDAVENTWTTITDVSTLNISKIIDCKAISNNGCIWSGYLTRISNGNLQFYNGITTWGSNTIILEYTKTS